MKREDVKRDKSGLRLSRFTSSRFKIEVSGFRLDESDADNATNYADHRKGASATCRRRTGGHPLKIVSQKLDDGWLYIVVVPSQTGVRASEHANFMSGIERELREQGEDDMLLIPALED